MLRDPNDAHAVLRAARTHRLLRAFAGVARWPDLPHVAPRSLRALLDERRVDVTPLMPGRTSPDSKRGPRFGFPTSATLVNTQSGKLVLEQAHTPNAGVGGQLLCRTLVEIAAANPSTAACEANNVPCMRSTHPDCAGTPRAGGTCETGSQCDDAAGVAGPCPAGVLWSRKTQDHSSQLTGSSVFDFEADGNAEAISTASSRRI